MNQSEEIPSRNRMFAATLRQLCYNFATTLRQTFLFAGRFAIKKSAAIVFNLPSEAA
ncbi:hypothetical protein DPMN_165155 [Dreissena polymorpha]|uniref:Uncharacterized protein n=1 Tax=Dreissena polymorpha TaxID=45954 RepID=A0A9D4EWA8_DREPO|nr:hypothetical protein DPMN_165155 [Dreissena polymorpha]